MSDNLGKKLRILAIVIGSLGAVASFLMAFINIKGSLGTAFIWIIIAVVSLLLIIPLYCLGVMADAITDHRARLSQLYDKFQRDNKVNTHISSDPSGIDKYSPSKRIKVEKVASGTMRAVSTGTTSAPVYATTSVRTAKSEDFTRQMQTEAREAVKVDLTQTPVVRKVSTGEATAVFSAAEVRPKKAPQPVSEDIEETSDDIAVPTPKTAPSPRTYKAPEGSFFTTTSLDKYEVNSRSKSITRYLSVPASSTIAAGGLHTVAIRENGLALATGYATYGQCDVSSWTGLTAVAAGNHHTVGLRSNGTCVACGFSGYGQCDVGGWSNICAISAGVGHTVGLLEDGSCVAVGDNTYGQCNVFDWIDIIAISAGYNYTVGLRADGTIIAVGANTDGNWGANRWGSIVSIASGGLHTVGLRGDGTCVACGNNANEQCEVSSWTGVKAITAGNYHTVALLSNGKVSAAGFNGYGQCNVSAWENVVAISAGRNHTIGLTKNGTLLATGDDTYGQCNVGSFSNIKLSAK